MPEISTSQTPTVSIIIPHYLGDILLDCLASIYDHKGDVSFEVIVADDQPHDDGSIGRVLDRWPGIQILKTGGSKGLAFGCNRGLEVAKGRFAILLNNDVEVSAGWLEALVTAADADDRIGACQPKVRSMREKEQLDSEGAAGGMMDIYAYPFCLGRVFDRVEMDEGQYDESRGGKIYLVESVDDVGKLKVNNPDKLSYVTQTTLSMDDTARIITALRERFPSIQGPRKEDICYATQNRQDAVKQLALECDLVLVVGSPNSSNSNRLRELAERLGCTSYLIDSVDDIQPQWFDGKQRYGVTAGASAPEVLVQQVVSHLKKIAAQDPQELSGVEENIVFSMPKELRY